MQHPLQVALDAAGLTQGQLSAEIAALGLKRRNGKPLRPTQSNISEICSWKRGITTEQAEACETVLAGRGVKITAAALVFAKRPETKKPRRRAA